MSSALKLSVIIQKHATLYN